MAQRTRSAAWGTGPHLLRLPQVRSRYLPWPVQNAARWMPGGLVVFSLAACGPANEGDDEGGTRVERNDGDDEDD